MEDFILREIDKIGQLIAALLARVGLLKEAEDPAAAHAVARTELAEGLGVDIDTLLAGEDFVATLVDRHGFNDLNLEQFAALLFDLAAASDDREERIRLAAAVTTLYRYLNAKKAPASYDRYYILKELDRLIN